MQPLNYIRHSLWNARPYLSETSIKTKCLYLRRIALRLFKPRVPRALWIGVTYQCQCQCIHCFLGPQLNKSNTELTREEIYYQIENARRLGFMEICYFGGEPLIRKDIMELVRFASSKGLLTTVFTNGLLLDQKKVKELRDAGLSRCNVSLDSSLPEIHNKLRGHKGCFERAVEGIKHMQEAGIKCTIWTYASKHNAQDTELKTLKALIGLGRELKVNGVFILFPISTGTWLLYDSETILSQDERERVRSLLNPPFVEMEFPSENTQCKAGKNFIYITPEGDVSLCPAMSYFYGNVHQESLSTILGRLNREVNKSKPEGCGECTMNINSFREKIDIGTKNRDVKEEVIL